MDWNDDKGKGGWQEASKEKPGLELGHLTPGPSDSSLIPTSDF